MVKCFSILNLQSGDAFPALAALRGSAAKFDRFNIPTRYPNGLPEQTPAEVYERDDAVTGIGAAAAFVQACEAAVAAG